MSSSDDSFAVEGGVPTFIGSKGKSVPCAVFELDVELEFAWVSAIGTTGATLLSSGSCESEITIGWESELAGGLRWIGQ